MKTKVCTKCKEKKPISEFGKDKGNKDGLNYNCKECINKYWREHRQKNREYYREYRKKNEKHNKEYRKEYYKENRERLLKQKRAYYQENKEYSKKYHERYNQERRDWLDGIKIQFGCEICGYNKCARALVFHHTDLGKKEDSISQMYLKSKEIILKEIKKCVILCANCHLELHHKVNVRERV